MAAPYSLDLRERAVRAAQEAEMSRAEVAWQFGISEATLYVWLRRQKQLGSLAPRPHGGGQPPSLDKEGMRELASLVKQQNDCTLEEYRTQVQQKLGVSISRSALHRALEKLKLPRKKDATRRRAESARRPEEA